MIMDMSKCFKMLLIVGACILWNASSFASEVLWDKQVIDGIEVRKGSALIDAQILTESGRMINDRLEQLRSTGKLPFKTVVIDDYQNNDWQSKMQQEDYLAIVPVITSDMHQSRVVEYRDLKYYRYDVRAEMNILLCSFDGSNLKIYYNLPLANQAVLGGSLDDALTEPLSDSVLKEQFLYNIEQLVDEISFPANLEKQLANPYLPTYQVNDIIFAQGAKVNLEPDEELELKTVLASTFTNQYAAKYSDRIVLPSPFSGKRWKKEVVQHITGGLINSGEYALEQEESADVPVKLAVDQYDITANIANKYSIMGDINFTTGLSAYEGSKEKPIATVKAVTTFRVPLDLKYQYSYKPWSIFNDAAMELGQQLKKK